MNKKVIIIGGEGNGGVIAACIEDNRKRFGDLEWEVAGFVNDYETQVCGYHARRDGRRAGTAQKSGLPFHVGHPHDRPQHTDRKNLSQSEPPR